MVHQQTNATIEHHFKFFFKGTPSICTRWNARRRTSPTRRSSKRPLRATSVKAEGDLTEVLRQICCHFSTIMPLAESLACRHKFRQCRSSQVTRDSSTGRHITECRLVNSSILCQWFANAYPKRCQCFTNTLSIRTFFPVSYQSCAKASPKLCQCLLLWRTYLTFKRTSVASELTEAEFFHSTSFSADQVLSQIN